MAAASQAMLKDSLNAFVNKDSQLAYEVCKRDDEVDALNHEIFMELLKAKPEDQTPVERVIDLILVAKNLERVADHSTNICEDIIYMVDGKNIKHHITD
jgi:phosphate transport system protein